MNPRRTLAAVRVAAVLAVLAPVAAEKAHAANKELERLQFQVASLQSQLATLQRAMEDNAREVKRLNEALAEQNATQRRAAQDQRVANEGIQSTLKEIADRLSEIGDRMRAARAQPATPTELAPGPGPVPAPGAGPQAPPPRELYSAAYADFARGNYDLAIQGFQEYLKNYSDSELADNAQYWIGECHYGKQKFSEAVEAWDALLRGYPSSDKLPDARVKKGMALEKLGRRTQALLEYRYVVDRYPNSPAARLAREKLQ
jgi:tol-pal system protein YbgF